MVTAKKINYILQEIYEETRRFKITDLEIEKYICEANIDILKRRLQKEIEDIGMDVVKEMCERGEIYVF